MGSRSKGGKDFTGSTKRGAAPTRRSKGSRPTSAASRGNSKTMTGKPATAGTRTSGNRRGTAASRANDKELEQLRNENKRLQKSMDELEGNYNVLQQQHGERTRFLFQASAGHRGEIQAGTGGGSGTSII